MGKELDTIDRLKVARAAGMGVSLSPKAVSDFLEMTESAEDAIKLAIRLHAEACEECDKALGYYNKVFGILGASAFTLSCALAVFLYVVL
jgi:hypothetical protein